MGRTEQEIKRIKYSFTQKGKREPEQAEDI
jgi:hypothetical protein